jgi:hypothetical protein
MILKLKLLETGKRLISQSLLSRLGKKTMNKLLNLELNFIDSEMANGNKGIILLI